MAAAAPFRRDAAILIIVGTVVFGAAAGAAIALIGSSWVPGLVAGLEMATLTALAGYGIALKRNGLMRRTEGRFAVVVAIANRILRLLAPIVLLIALTVFHVSATVWLLVAYLSALTLPILAMFLADAARRRH